MEYSEREKLAIGYATHYHDGKMYGKNPYTYHLKQVRDILLRFGFDSVSDEDYLVVAWLHDILEDCCPYESGTTEFFEWQLNTAQDIATRFGYRVCSLVMALTQAPGKIREDRVISMYPALIAIPDAIIVKLADRIANVEECIVTKNSKLYHRYFMEYKTFREKLIKFKNVRTSGMWDHLDDRMSNGVFDLQRKTQKSTKVSAGLLPYRINKETNLLEVFLVIPGGPYYEHCDQGYWGISKGELSDEEKQSPDGFYSCAVREFTEETGSSPHIDSYVQLSACMSKSGKTIHCFCFEDVHDSVSFSQDNPNNSFTLEWPPKSGTIKLFQEVRDGRWFAVKDALMVIQSAQYPFIVQALSMFIGE